MSRVALPLAALALVFSLQRAAAQEAPPPPVATAPPVVEAPPPEPAPPPPIDPSVNVSTLAPPDAFSVAGRQTGLPQDLWRETPRELMRAVLPLIAGKPLTPAAAALARRVLATGAPGPKGSSDDAGASDSDLAGARAGALVALGDVEAAAAILQRAPGVDRSSALSQAAAESALLAGDETRACAVAQALTIGRDDIYWLRLRAYCQAIGGQAGAAHLTLDLAQAQARDATFGRLMTAKLGGGAAGAASLRNGLDLALSRSLGLDLTTAKASPAVAQALSGGPPATVEIAPPAADLAAFAEAMAAGRAPPPRISITTPDPKTAARIDAATLLAAALGDPSNASTWALAVPEAKAPLGRNLALQAAGAQKQMGTTALLALWTCAEAGAAGPSIGDRVRIVMALHAAGLDEDARAFALEGLAGLK